MNGRHFSKPRYNISGLENFTGTTLHSHNYRIPEPFKGQRVLVIGAGASGRDICLEVAQTAREVLLSHTGSIRASLESPFPDNICEIEKVTGITDNGSIMFVTKETISRKDIDAIILCTGYEYEFPFLTSECGIQVTNHRVHPLYKHVVNAKHPSMAFIGLNFNIIPSLICESQIKFYRSFLLERNRFPSHEVMEQEESQDHHQRVQKGYNVRHAHILHGELQWEYIKELATLGGFDGVKPVIEALYKYVIRQRQVNVYYKDMELEVINDEQWKQL